MYRIMAEDELGLPQEVDHTNSLDEAFQLVLDYQTVFGNDCRIWIEPDLHVG